MQLDPQRVVTVCNMHYRPFPQQYIEWPVDYEQRPDVVLSAVWARNLIEPDALLCRRQRIQLFHITLSRSSGSDHIHAYCIELDRGPVRSAPCQRQLRTSSRGSYRDTLREH